MLRVYSTNAPSHMSTQPVAAANPTDVHQQLTPSERAGEFIVAEGDAKETRCGAQAGGWQLPENPGGLGWACLSYCSHNTLLLSCRTATNMQPLLRHASASL